MVEYLRQFSEETSDFSESLDSILEANEIKMAIQNVAQTPNSSAKKLKQ